MTRVMGCGTWDRMIGILGMDGVKVVTGAAATVLLLALANPVPALADTIEAALVRAYQNNPQLNAQRAAVRATDENVPQALSGYRPKVAVTASAGYQYTDLNSTFGGTATQIVRSEVHGTDPPRSAGLTVTQTLYNGNQTANKTRVAESQVSGAREGLRVLEQTVLLSAATVYMDYLRNSAIVEVQSEQRSRSRSDAEADQGPFQCRRSNSHRRRPVRSTACGRQDAAARGSSDADDHASQLPSYYRQRATGAGAGLAGRSLSAGFASRSRRTQPDRKSERDRGDVSASTSTFSRSR